MCNFMADSSDGRAPTTYYGRRPLFPRQVFVFPGSHRLNGMKRRKGSLFLFCSQVVRVHNGEVGVLAVGGALVRAGGARRDARHQRVVEGPGRALRLHPHQAPPPPDGRGALGRPPTVGGLQVSILGHQDVVVPVLPVGAERGRHLRTTKRCACVSTNSQLLSLPSTPHPTKPCDLVRFFSLYCTNLGLIHSIQDGFKVTWPNPAQNRFRDHFACRLQLVCTIMIRFKLIKIILRSCESKPEDRLIHLLLRRRHGLLLLLLLVLLLRPHA